MIPNMFQCLCQAFDSLLWKLHKYVPGGSSVADLYAGAGVIGLSLATSRKCRQEQRLFSSFVHLRRLCIYVHIDKKIDPNFIL